MLFLRYVNSKLKHVNKKIRMIFKQIFFKKCFKFFFVFLKTRNNSKAELAGLKLNDTILYINDVPTSNLSLEAAAELIDNSENLCLIVSSKSSPIAKDESPDHVSELIDEFRYFK